MKRGILVAFAVLALSVSLMPRDAEASDKFAIRAVGMAGGQVQSDVVERPFYDALPGKTGEKLEVTFRQQNELDIKEEDLLSILKTGAFDIMVVGLGGAEGIDPFMAMPDLAGIAPDYETLIKVVESAEESIGKRLRERHNSHLLAMFGLVGQVFYCKGEDINSLDDLKGKKIRVYNKPLADLVEQLGAVSVTISLGEVYTALQRGVADCAITGTMSGNNLGFYEVTDRLIPLSVAWAVDIRAANLDFWNGLSSEQQKFLTEQFDQLENQMRTIGRELTEEGINCNTGKQPCERGKLGNMQLVPVTKADARRMQETARKVLVPDWAARCEKAYAGCTEIWNQTVGSATGIILQ